MRRGPHGEAILVYQTTGTADADGGATQVTLYIYSGRNVIVAGVSNQDERRWLGAISPVSPVGRFASPLPRIASSTIGFWARPVEAGFS